MGAQDNNFVGLGDECANAAENIVTRVHVDAGEGFVEQKHGGLDCEGACDFDAASLTAGQFLRSASGKMFDAHLIEKCERISIGGFSVEAATAWSQEPRLLA